MILLYYVSPYALDDGLIIFIIIDSFLQEGGIVLPVVHDTHDETVLALWIQRTRADVLHTNAHAAVVAEQLCQSIHKHLNKSAVYIQLNLDQTVNNEYWSCDTI